MIIAIDGPAGSGKSTIAREVAKRLGMRYLDTGAMYRAITLLALEAGLIPDRIAEAGVLATSAALRFEERPDDLSRVFVGDREVTDEIRGRLVSQNVSAVSADAGVRAVLTDKQRSEAAKGNTVLEGRDMGTVVVPDAEVKVFLTASIGERARRRQLQLQAQGVSQAVDELIDDITARDAYDSGRTLAPLRKADDAVEIDTTGMSVEEVVAAVCSLAAQKSPAPREEAPTSGSPQRYALSRLSRGPLDTWFYRFVYSIIPPFFRFAFRLEVNGAEHIPVSGPVVIASNHRSNLDPFFVGSVCSRQIHFMAKAELWKFKPLGWAVGKLGTFPVNRGEMDRRAVKEALELLSGGAVLGLFPEGHRQREKDLGDIRPGVSLFSLRDGVVTVPIVLVHTDRIVKNHLLRFPRVVAHIGPRIDIPGKDMPRAARAAIASRRLVEAMNRLWAEAREGK